MEKEEIEKLAEDYAKHMEAVSVIDEIERSAFIKGYRKAQEEIQLLKNEIESLGRLSDIQHQTIMDLEKAQEEKPTLKDFTAKIEKEAEDEWQKFLKKPKEQYLDNKYSFVNGYIKARLMGLEERK